MNGFQAFGAVPGNAGSACAGGAPGALFGVTPFVEGTTMRHIAPAAHAAWAVDAIAQQRKRRTADTTEASVDRGYI